MLFHSYLVWAFFTIVATTLQLVFGPSILSYTGHKDFTVDRKMCVLIGKVYPHQSYLSPKFCVYSHTDHANYRRRPSLSKAVTLTTIAVKVGLKALAPHLYLSPY